MDVSGGLSSCLPALDGVRWDSVRFDWKTSSVQTIRTHGLLIPRGCKSSMKTKSRELARHGTDQISPPLTATTRVVCSGEHSISTTRAVEHSRGTVAPRPHRTRFSAAAAPDWADWGAPSALRDPPRNKKFYQVVSETRVKAYGDRMQHCSQGVAF